MSSNFLDTSGSCTGLDAHLFIALGALGVPVPCPMVPHIVFWKHSWTSRDWRIATSVTTRGNPVLQNNWAMMCVLHVPIPVSVPHPIEAVQILSIIAAASAAPQLTAHKVTGQGSALCTAISGSFGLNLDCGDFIAFSSDTNMNTVMTQPTLGDFVAAVLSTGLNFLYAWGVSNRIGKKFPTDKTPLVREVEKYMLNVVKNALASVSVALAQSVADLINSKADDGSWAGDPCAVGISKGTTVVQKLIDGEKL